MRAVNFHEYVINEDDLTDNTEMERPRVRPSNSLLLRTAQGLRINTNRSSTRLDEMMNNPQQYTAPTVKVVEPSSPLLDRSNTADRSPLSNEALRSVQSIQLQTIKSSSDMKYKRRDSTFKVIRRSAESEKHLMDAFKTQTLIADSSERWIWDGFMLLCILYYAFIVPFTWTDLVSNFDKIQLPSISFVIVESIITALSIVDIILSFFTSYVNKNWQLVDDPKLVSQHYLHTWFLIDLASSFPFDLILVAFHNNYWAITYQLRLLRLFKIKRLFELTMTNNYATTSHVLFYFQIMPILMVTISGILFVHICSIIWMTLTEIDKFDYFTSLYLILYTLSTCGYGDIIPQTRPQRFFCCFLFVMAMFVNGWLVGNIANILQKSDIEKERRDQMRATLGVLRHFDVPTEMRREVLAFQFHLLHHNVSTSYAQVINNLPKAMQKRIGLFIRIKFVAEVPLFTEVSTECLVALAQKLKSVVFEPEEYIIKAGDVGREMYFLWHGYAAVYSADGTFLTTNGKGSYFGEIALMMEISRTASVKALTYCDLFRLDKSDFREIMDSFGELKETVEKEATKRECVTHRALSPRNRDKLVTTLYAETISDNNSLPTSRTPMRIDTYRAVEPSPDMTLSIRQPSIFPMSPSYPSSPTRSNVGGSNFNKVDYMAALDSKINRLCESISSLEREMRNNHKQTTKQLQQMESRLKEMFADEGD